MEENGARERLRQAGVDLFAELGYEGASVREIVQRAGVTKPVLYYYYGSKDGLFRSLLSEVEEKQREMLDETLSRPGTILEKLSFLATRFCEEVNKSRGLALMMRSLAFGPRRSFPNDVAQGFKNRMKETMKTLYAEAVTAGDMKEVDPETAASLFAALLDYPVFYELDAERPVRPDQTLNMLRLALEGLARK